MIKSRRQLGLIIWGQAWETKGLLCRDHARQQLGKDLAFTAILGWWGVLSFISNIEIVTRQIRALSGLSKLAPPETPAAAERPITSAQVAPDERA